MRNRRSGSALATGFVGALILAWGMGPKALVEAEPRPRSSVRPAARAAPSARDAALDRAAAIAQAPQATLAYLPWIARDAGGIGARVAGRIGGGTRAMAVRDRYLFLGGEDRVAMYDRTQLRQPQMVGAVTDLGAPVEALVPMGDRLVAALGPAGLRVLDLPPVTEPGQPAITLGSAMALPGPAWDLVPRGDQVFVAAGAAGLVVVDLGPDRPPRQLARLALPGDLRALVPMGDRLLLATGPEILMVETADPTAPRIIARQPLAPDPGPAAAAVLHGSTAWLAFPSGSIRPVALDDPADPRPGTPIAVDAALDLAISDATLLVASGSGGLLTFDLVDPRSPRPGSTVTVEGGLAALAAPGGGVAYGGGPRRDLAAFDLGAGGAASLGWSHPVLGDAVDVVAGRNLAYLLTDRPVGIQVVAFLADGTPREEGFLPLEARPEDLRMAAAEDGHAAYLLYYNALEAIDGTAPGKPEKRRTLAVPDATRITRMGDHLALAGDGLRMIDIRVPDDPRQVAYSPRAGGAEAITSNGDGTVYFAQRSPIGARLTDLFWYDVNTRARPAPIGSLPNVRSTVDLAWGNGYIFQVFDQDRQYGLRVFDSALAERRLVPGSAYLTDGYTRRVVYDEGARGQLYLVEEGYFDRVQRRQRGRHGVHVLGITEPERPRRLQFLPFAEPVGGIAVAGDRLFVAARERGLVVYELAP